MKRIVLLLLSLALLVGLCFMLGSCGACKHENFSNDFEIVEPTCTDSGKYVYTCLDCGEKVYVEPAADDITMTAFGHTEADAVQSQAPTCTEAGVSVVTCEVCDAVISSSEIEALGHELDEDEYEFDENGHWHACTREGCTYTSEVTACSFSLQPMDAQTHVEACVCGAIRDGSSAEHSWNAGVIETAPTCSTVGYKAVTCTECGFATSLELEKTAHTFDETEALSDGKQHWFACTVCGEEKAGSRVNCTLGSAVVVPPSNTSCAPGTSTRTCSVCGNASVEAIPSSMAHKLTNGTFDAVTNSISWSCDTCNASYTVSGTAAANTFGTEDAAGLTQFSPPRETAWLTQIVGDDDKYVECLANEVFVNGTNGTAYRYSGPLMHLDQLDEFFVTLDVRMKGTLCGPAAIALKATTGWLGGNVNIQPDGSIVLDGTTVAPAGTINAQTFTNVTFKYVAATGEFTFWINGVQTETVISSHHVGKHITYINLIIPGAKQASDIGSGLQFDNIAYASGANAGVTLQVAAAD